MSPEIVADNEEVQSEPEGFWDPVHKDVRRIAKLGEDDNAPGGPQQEG